MANNNSAICILKIVIILLTRQKKSSKKTPTWKANVGGINGNCVEMLISRAKKIFVSKLYEVLLRM
jgi:hypothetical protein